MSDYSNYRISYKDFRRTINLTIGRNADEEFEHFCLGALFRAWGSNQMLYSPEYEQILRDIFGKEYTAEQIRQSMKNCSDKSRKIAVPAFFQEIVTIDKTRKTDNAENTLGALYEFLALLALLNGDFTIEEASAVAEVITVLRDYAIGQGVPVDSNIPRQTKSITEKNNSYSLPVDLVLENDPCLDYGSKIKGTDDLLQFLGGEHKAPETGNVAKTSGDNAPKTQEAEEELPERSEEKFNELMEELNGLVGLVKVKEDIQTLLNFIKINKLREERGMKKPKISYHLVFTGNPGTGKTTVARLVAQLYYQMGILPKGQLVETDRSALVAGYLGQTAIKTKEVIDRAMGGVLFIDEAYSLANDEQDSYGKEAIETILKAMEDHRDELVVIVAGYTDLMHKFINSNPGLNSRFNKYFLFPDYTGPELLGIFQVYCKKNGYHISEETSQELEKRFTEMYENRGVNFGNGRDVRNIFEKAINNQANRLAAKSDVSDEELQEILLEDIDKAIEAEKDRPVMEEGSEEGKLEDMLKALKESTQTE